MQVILTEAVPQLGPGGQIVKVRDGYARNYLIPRGLAVVASPRNLREVEHHRRLAAQREETRRKEFQGLKDRLDGMSVNVAKQIGAEGKLFGSVTSREIADALKAQGITVDRKAIEIAEPIRSQGVHEVPINLGHNLTANIKVWVVSE